MNKAKLNYWIDVLLVVCLVVVSITGLVLLFSFVSGEPGVGRGIVFLGTQKHDWIEWHNFFGLAMIILMFVHLGLHFNWLGVKTKNLFAKGKD